ncbi:MAG: preprotein translocase subunit SecE [Gammaproteobacteria bacterium]|nr:preprotein translocase subunit SecE [Gammaproteobacteria bacterium]
MVSKTDLQDSSGDKIKLILAAVIGVAGLVAFYWFAEQSLLARVIGLLLVAGLVAYIIYQTALGKRVVGFFRDARTEVRKVVWPSRAETTQTTLTVIVIVIIVGIFLWLFDSVLASLFRMLTGA